MDGLRGSKERNAAFARKRYLDLLLLLALGAIWGASYLFIKVIVAEVPALTLVGIVILVVVKPF